MLLRAHLPNLLQKEKKKKEKEKSLWQSLTQFHTGKGIVKCNFILAWAV